MHGIIVLLMRSKRVLSFNSTTVLNFLWQRIKTFITFLWIYKAVIAGIYQSINIIYLIPFLMSNLIRLFMLFTYFFEFILLFRVHILSIFKTSQAIKQQPKY